MIHRRRNTRTDLDMVASGQWAKVGKKHFRHVSGIEVTYDCNAWRWLVSSEPRLTWGTLEVAAHVAEKAGAIVLARGMVANLAALARAE